jgi:hypothetical protein
MDSLISNFLNIIDYAMCIFVEPRAEGHANNAGGPYVRKVPCIAEEVHAVFRRRSKAIVFKKEFSSGSKYPFRLAL